MTHGPCRSAKYTAEQPGALPTDADPADFPVPAGAEMPDIPGCAERCPFGSIPDIDRYCQADPDAQAAPGTPVRLTPATFSFSW